MKNLRTFVDCNMPLHKNVCVPTDDCFKLEGYTNITNPYLW